MCDINCHKWIPVTFLNSLFQDGQVYCSFSDILCPGDIEIVTNVEKLSTSSEASLIEKDANFESTTKSTLNQTKKPFLKNPKQLD